MSPDRCARAALFAELLDRALDPHQRERFWRSVEAEQSSSADDDQSFEPVTVGHVVAADFDPYEGVTGQVAFHNVGADSLFARIGAISSTEPIGAELGRLLRAGFGGLLNVSTVTRETYVRAAADDGLPCLRGREISEVVSVDLVVFAATTARLIEPIEGK